MAYRVELTRRALRDLGDIYRRVEAKTSRQAVQWFDGIEKAIYSLENNPYRGPITPEDRTVRHLLYGKKPRAYRIIFVIEEDISTVFVLQIRGPGRAPMHRL